MCQSMTRRVGGSQGTVGRLTRAGFATLSLLLVLVAFPRRVAGQRLDATRAGLAPASAIRGGVPTSFRFQQSTGAQIPAVPHWHRGLQLVGGLAGAWTGGLVAYKTAEHLADDRRVKGDEGYSPAGNWAYVAGSLVGAALGVAGAGHLLRDHGAVPAALAGAAAPTLLLLTVVDDPYLAIYGLVFAAPLQAVGAMLGYAHRD